MTPHLILDMAQMQTCYVNEDRLPLKKRKMLQCKLKFYQRQRSKEQRFRMSNLKERFRDLSLKGRTPIGHVHLNQFIDFLHQQTELIHNETNRYQLLENYNTQLGAELETETCENQGFAAKLEVIIVSYNLRTL